MARRRQSGPAAGRARAQDLDSGVEAADAATGQGGVAPPVVVLTEQEQGSVDDTAGHLRGEECLKDFSRRLGHLMDWLAGREGAGAGFIEDEEMRADKTIGKVLIYDHFSPNLFLAFLAWKKKKDNGNVRNCIVVCPYAWQCASNRLVLTGILCVVQTMSYDHIRKYKDAVAWDCEVCLAITLTVTLAGVPKCNSD